MNSSAVPRYLDANEPEEARIDDLLARLTLEEKIQCLSTNPSVPRLGLKGSGHVEGLHGLTLGGSGRWGGDQPIATTTFPQAIGLAETWDPDAVRRVAEVEATEARYFFHHPDYQRGGIVVRAPNADLGRDPRWGRTEECYGEDPFLVSRMAVAFTRGLQGDDPRYWKAAALLKHFLANSNEDERERSSSEFDERLFHEYYAATFRTAIVEGGSRAFMAAYNKYNGVPCTTHPMLDDIARKQWGQDGIVCTDGGAFKLLVSAHQAYPDLVQAAGPVIRAGIGQFLDDFEAAVTEAVERGLLSEADIERSLRGNFRVMLRLGLWDEGVVYAEVRKEDPNPVDDPEHQRLAREITARSVVLLKNSNGLLPLTTEQPLRGRAPHRMKIAVIGPLSDVVHVDWYSGTPPYLVTPLEGIRTRAGSDVEVLACKNNDTSEATRIARLADVCVVCVGNHPTGDDSWAKVTRKSYGKESVDRRSIELEDEALVRLVFEANPKTVVVLISSFPYAINWCQGNVPAIVHLTHCSQELGNALADVLFGDVDPGGRLVQTWPKSLEQLPERLDYDLRKGRTYLYFDGQPLYSFGFGLSYTTFTYRELSLSRDSLPSDGSLTVSVEVENIGRRRGDDVVQLYVRHLASKVSRPLKELKGFRRLSLDAGAKQRVELELHASSLAYWDATRAEFVVESGEIEVMIGKSSTDLVLKARCRVREG